MHSEGVCLMGDKRPFITMIGWVSKFPVLCKGETQTEIYCVLLMLNVLI